MLLGILVLMFTWTYGVFTVTDLIPILFPILMWVPWQRTVIFTESDILSESGSVNALLGLF